MKISELNTKSFLGAAGAAANSYVLINYEDNTTSAPVTYKASIDELGKAIANNLQLYKKTQNGAVTTSVNNGAYADGTAEQFITSAALTGLASTGYVTNAVANAGGTAFDPMVYEADDCSKLMFLSPDGIMGAYSGDNFIPVDIFDPIEYKTEGLDQLLFMNESQTIGYMGTNGFAPITNIAYLGTNNGKSCIYNSIGVLQGYLSAT